MKTDQPGYDIEIETEGGAPANHAAPQQAASPRQGDDRSNRIERQHSQEMAIRTVSLLMTNGLISTGRGNENEAERVDGLLPARCRAHGVSDYRNATGTRSSRR